MNSLVGLTVEMFVGESFVERKARWWIGEYGVRAMWIESPQAKQAQMELEK